MQQAAVQHSVPWPADTAGISLQPCSARQWLGGWERRKHPSSGPEAALPEVGTYSALFILDYFWPNSMMILQIHDNDTKSRIWLCGSFAACWKVLQVIKKKHEFKNVDARSLDFASHLRLLLCIALWSHFPPHRSICCLVFGILLSFPNPWTFRSYFISSCWSSAMFKPSLSAISKI